jgi:hypothetical protein
MQEEAELVLSNWIEQALSSAGQLGADTPPAKWIAARFMAWWRSDFESHLDEWLGDAEMAMARIRAELNRLGGWDKCGEALHECAHLADALASLRNALVQSQ